MTPGKNAPLTPDSLAANGMQGADAKAVGLGEIHHKTRRARMRGLARLALTSAQAQLDLFASTTDEPPAEVVAAADFLDEAERFLALAEPEDARCR